MLGAGWQGPSFLPLIYEDWLVDSAQFLEEGSGSTKDPFSAS